MLRTRKTFHQRRAAVPAGWDKEKFAYEFDVEPDELVVPVMELFDAEGLDPDAAVFHPGYWGFLAGNECGRVEQVPWSGAWHRTKTRLKPLPLR